MNLLNLEKKKDERGGRRSSPTHRKDGTEFRGEVVATGGRDISPDSNCSQRHWLWEELEKKGGDVPMVGNRGCRM